MKKNIFFIVNIFNILIVSCYNDVEGDLAVLEQNFIWNPESWSDICNSTFCPNINNAGIWNSSFFKPSIYAKAVGNIQSDNPTPPNARCSGFLVDNEWFVTANHCELLNDPQQLTMGLYGDNQIAGMLGVLEARKRFRQFIGYPSDTAYSNDFFTKFECGYNSDSNTEPQGYRDIKYYACAPNVTGTGVQVYPGDLYGHLNTDIRMLSDDEIIFSASVNRTNLDATYSSVNHVLISDGWVYDGEDSCEVGGYDNCFETVGDDLRCGSSGGLIMTPQGRAIGVFKANGTLSGSDECDRTLKNESDAWKMSNRVTYLNSKVDDVFANTTPLISSGVIVSGTISTTSWIGGPTGSLFQQNCPDKYYAAGVIGSTAHTGNVGNFGIVCVPYNRSKSYRELDRAKVIAGGSVGTHFYLKFEDLNTYYNEFYSNESGVYIGVDRFKPQNVQMCLPGYGLYGLRLRSNNARIQKVEAIHCRSFTPFDSPDYTTTVPSILTTPNPPSTAAHEVIGQISGTGTIYNIVCPGMVKGLRIRSGWETDGLGLNCYAF